MEAELRASNLGAVIGLAIGAVMPLAKTKPTEERAIQDEQDFNEFLVQMEAEEEHNWQQTI